MLDFTNAKVALKFRLPQDRAYDDESLAWALTEGANKVWRARAWKFAEKRGQIDTKQVYSTGTITTLANLGTAVTFSGTSLTDEHVGRFLRIADENRDYEITAVGSATTCTIKDPYEGAAIVAGSSAFKIIKKVYYLPGDYASGFMFKESAGRRWLPLMSRQQHERMFTDANQTGQATRVIEAGFSTSPMATAGTVSLTPNSKTVTGTSTGFGERMKGLTFVVDGFPARFMVASIASATSLTLDRVWPYEAQALATYEVAPAGSPLIELYPAHDYDGSVEIWYLRKPPEFNKGSDRPQWYDDLHDIWLDAALNALGLLPDEYLNARIGELANRDGIEREQVYSIDAPGDNSNGMGGDYYSSTGSRFNWGDL